MIGLLIRKMMKTPQEKIYAEDIIKGKEDIAAALCLIQDEIYKSEYQKAKDLFRDSIKASKLNREQILYIKFKLRGFLKPHMQYYTARYKNDAHEIYTLLKSPFLNNYHYNDIISTIQRFIQ